MLSAAAKCAHVYAPLPGYSRGLAEARHIIANDDVKTIVGRLKAPNGETYTTTKTVVRDTTGEIKYVVFDEYIMEEKEKDDVKTIERAVTTTYIENEKGNLLAIFVASNSKFSNMYPTKIDGHTSCIEAWSFGCLKGCICWDNLHKMSLDDSVFESGIKAIRRSYETAMNKQKKEEDKKPFQEILAKDDKQLFEYVKQIAEKAICADQADGKACKKAGAAIPYTTLLQKGEDGQVFNVSDRLNGASVTFNKITHWNSDVGVAMQQCITNRSNNYLYILEVQKFALENGQDAWGIRGNLTTMTADEKITLFNENKGKIYAFVNKFRVAGKNDASGKEQAKLLLDGFPTKEKFGYASTLAAFHSEASVHTQAALTDMISEACFKIVEAEFNKVGATLSLRNTFFRRQDREPLFQRCSLSEILNMEPEVAEVPSVRQLEDADDTGRSSSRPRH